MPETANPQAATAAVTAKKKTRYSVADQVKDVFNSCLSGGFTKEISRSLFPFFTPSVFSEARNRYATIIGNLDQRKTLQIQDLAANKNADQMFVFLLTNSTRGQMKQLDDGRIVNLLSQEAQMLTKDLPTFVIHKRELYDAKPYGEEDRLAYEPRLVWEPTTDPIARELLAAYLTHSKIVKKPAAVVA